MFELLLKQPDKLNETNSSKTKIKDTNKLFW